jgi:hypothetical protein
LNSTDTWLRVTYFNERDADIRELDAARAAFAVSSLPESERPYFGPNGMITNYAWAGRPDRARAALAEYDAGVRDSTLRMDLANDRSAALAEILLAEGKPLDAIAAFREADRLPDGPAHSCTICLSVGLSRAFDAAGMTDSAIVYYEQYLSDPYALRMVDWVDPLLMPIFLKRLAELYETKRDYAKAAENYRKFIALWTNAEPEFQPLVEDARARLRRMADTERREN